jgi:hypothetical protein
MSGYLVPAKKLAPALLEHLKLGPRTTEELCNHFGYTSSPIRHRLRGLEDDGLVRHEKLVYTDGGGSYYLWHAGKRTGDMKSRPAPLANPLNRGPLLIRRDPLVAAFFGAPAIERRAPANNSPRCTVCGIEQGVGHQAGCIVAMVAA